MSDRVVWSPQPKQALALTSPVYELFYGGARGGGKSDFLLMDFTKQVDRWGAEHRGVIFRKTYPELEELLRRALELYVPLGATFHRGERTWTFPSGSTLKMRHLEADDDVHHYQGHQYCVGVETPIVMGDGLTTPAGDVRVGDHVMTLEGPRTVVAVVPPYLAPCVAVGNQVNPVWHPVLTDRGWQSYASLSGTDSTRFEATHRESGRLPSVSARVVRAELIRWKDDDGSPREYRFSSRLLRPYAGRPGGMLPPLSASSWGPRPGAVAFEGWPRPARGGGSECAEPGRPTKEGSRSGCPDDSHSGGGSSPGGPGIDRSNIRIPGGAGECTRGRFDLGALDSIPSCTRRIEESYPHPYVDEERAAEWESVSEALAFTPCGRRMVCDFTVAGPNHYITSGGIVNKNTWIGFDELTDWKSDYCYVYLHSCARSAAGVPVRVRAAGNPGGPGHVWVKQRFVDNGIPMQPHADSESGLLRVFVPALLDDNLVLMRNDPTYEQRLKNLPEHLYRAYRFGDWNIFAGQAFAEWRPHEHLVKPFPLHPDWRRFAALDWGYAKPYSIGWWCRTGDGRMIRYREWYGCERLKHNVGIKRSAAELAVASFNISMMENCKEMVLDPACWSKVDSDQSIAEKFEAAGWICHRGINDRKSGASRLHDLLQARMDDGRPGLLVFDTCPAFARTIPSLVVSQRDPEDVDTTGEDHTYDETRYALMSRLTTNRVAPTPYDDSETRRVHDEYDPLRWGL